MVKNLFVELFYQFRSTFDVIGVGATIILLAVAIVLVIFWVGRLIWKIFPALGLVGGLAFIAYMIASGFVTLPIHI